MLNVEGEEIDAETKALENGLVFPVVANVFTWLAGVIALPERLL